MKLTPSTFKNSEWLKAVSEAILLTGSDEFYPALGNIFTHIPETNQPMVIIFRDNSSPVISYFDSIKKDDYFRQAEQYVNGAYIFDPYYRASMEGISVGAYRLSEVSADNFKRTEYFSRYYKATKFHDEVTFMQTLPDGGHLHLSLGHSEVRGIFSKRVVNFLKSVSPIINGLILKHWNVSASEQPIAQSTDLHQALQKVLSCFGSSILTQREQAVLQLILHGHSNKSAAERLQITLATVKLHRKHIYQKLDISSQAELFYLFIDSLSCLSDAKDGDPLQYYMGLI